MWRFMSIICLISVTAPLAAQDLPNRRDALRLVFASDAEVESVVFPHPSLNEAEVTLLSTAVAQGLMPQMLYYGALAIAPDSGLADPQTTTAVGNFHDEDNAAAAALARCDAARPAAAAPCTVVLIVRPAGWSAGGPLQLSSGASDALQRDFRQLDRPRVFATSAATGQFGFGADEASALAACGAGDCRAVIADN